MIKVAVILTCHNRKDKTVTCLEHLFLVFDDYIKKSHNLIGLDVFLTDDGCTDGTVETVKDIFLFILGNAASRIADNKFIAFIRLID